MTLPHGRASNTALAGQRSSLVVPPFRAEEGALSRALALKSRYHEHVATKSLVKAWRRPVLAELVWYRILVICHNGPCRFVDAFLARFLLAVTAGVSAAVKPVSRHV